MTPQQEAIIRYIKREGLITSYEAYDKIGVTQLAARIGELEKIGIEFIRTRVKGKNRFGERTTWVEYRLKA